MEYEKCYVLEPQDARPAKRLRVEPRGLQASWKARHAAYKQAWGRQQESIKEELDQINASTVKDLADFLDEACLAPTSSKIPTGIISTGSDTSAHNTVLDQLDQLVQGAHYLGNRSIVPLYSSAGSNLKALLKVIIQKATARNEGIDEDDEDQPMSKRGPRLLNYDLQILANYARERGVKQIVIAIQDTEAFDSDLLSEIIELMACWRDRIPIVFLFSIATSLSFLQQRLSKCAVKCLEGHLFDVAPFSEEVEQVFKAISRTAGPLWLGSGVMNMLLERQTDFIQSIQNLVDALQYTYMSHYYANALSIFLDFAINYNGVPGDHFEAIRNLPSFSKLCERLLDHNERAHTRELLKNDEVLFRTVKDQVVKGKQALTDAMIGIEVLQELQQDVQGQIAASLSSLYGQVMSNKLKDSALIRSLMVSIRRAPSHTINDLMTSIISSHMYPEYIERCEALQGELEHMMKQADPTQPLRSEDDLKNSTLRATVVAQKVELSKQKSELSKQDAAYTKLLRQLTELLEEYFNEVFINPMELPFHEIFIYDLKSPHRETFTPRPRHAIERALAAPHDYLDCECCAPASQNRGPEEEATLASTQPATAVLYQLYLESSGNLINVSDLWQAFQAVIGDERKPEEMMALFQRGLAELKYLGSVKTTRKRVDHVGKVAWRGL